MTPASISWHFFWTLGGFDFVSCSWGGSHRNKLKESLRLRDPQFQGMERRLMGANYIGQIMDNGQGPVTCSCRSLILLCALCLPPSPFVSLSLLCTDRREMESHGRGRISLKPSHHRPTGSTDESYESQFSVIGGCTTKNAYS